MEPHRRLLTRDSFPTLKFIKPDGSAIDFNSQRNTASILAFMEEQGCSKLSETVRRPMRDGSLTADQAGRIPALDAIASQFFGPTSTRDSLLASASAIAQSLTTSADDLSAYYLKIMGKWLNDAEGARTWLISEGERLGKMANKKGSVTASLIEQLRQKQNILKAFDFIKVDKAQEVVDAVVEQAQQAAEAVAAKADEVIEAAQATATAVAERVKEEL